MSEDGYTEYKRKPVCTNDKSKKRKPLSKYKPKIIPIDDDDSDIIKADNIDDHTRLDSEHKMESYDLDESSSDDEPEITDSDIDDNESSDSDDDDSDSPKKQSITFAQFNSYDLQEKHDAIQELIESTTNDFVIKKLLIINNVLEFLSKYDSESLSNCFKLSANRQNILMTSHEGSKSKNLLNARIFIEAITYFNRNSILGKFLKLFKEFSNVTLNLRKKSSSKDFDELVENIQNLHDGKYKQFNINLKIDKEVIEESEFENNTAIKSVILKPSVKTIKKHAFLQLQIN